MRTKTESWGLHWFRRDLRLTGNPALEKNLERHHGRVVGFFCFDPSFLARPDFSSDRFAFFLRTLLALREDLRKHGGDLLVLDHGPKKAFPELWERVAKHPPATVSFNRDYEPFARTRDEAMSRWLTERDVEVLTERDHLLIEPHEIKKTDGGYYSVFTPFSRRWLERFADREVQERVSAQAKAKTPRLHLQWTDVLAKPPGDALETYLRETKFQVPLPDAGAKAALARLEEFAPKLKDYAKDRDFPELAGNSRLSVYFKNGSLTTAQAIARLGLERIRTKGQDGASIFLNELIWREFYYHILWHRPDVETAAFLEHYRELPWENDERKFSAWKEGRTGFPIVDAGMRELATTGFMHNRVRMIVASFLVKDLLIDWRWGERYFMERLLDGDLAPNNGGWQWAASTGCDPQPYFRVFNPELQSRKFDPEGHYIRAFVPELQRLSNKEIHAPDADRAKALGYPRPIVDHKTRRMKAIAMYKKERG